MLLKIGNIFISKLCVIIYATNNAEIGLGCGGYIVSTGNILKPAYPPSENSSAECMWYIDSSGSMNTTLITTQSKAIIPFPVIVSQFYFCFFQNFARYLVILTYVTF